MRKVQEMAFSDGLSAAAIERIRHKRVLAVAQLVLDIEPHRQNPKSTWEDVLPSFQKYGIALLNAEARELQHEAKSEEWFVTRLDALTQRVADHIMGEERAEASRLVH